MKLNYLESIGIAVLILFIAGGSSPILSAEPQSQEPTTGLIQSVTKNGQVKNVYYGDYAEGWNKEVDLSLDKKDWVLKVDNRDQFNQTQQYFHPSESDQDWTEIISIKRLVGPKVPTVKPEGIAKAMEGSVETVETSDHDVFYAGTVEQGKRYEMARVLIDKDVIFTLHYASQKRNAAREKEIKSMLKKAEVIYLDEKHNRQHQKST